MYEKMTIKTLNVPMDHPVFKDHFPGNPVVPGALLLQWILDSFGDAIDYPLEISQFKFFAPVRPGMTLTVVATAMTSKTDIECNEGDVLIAKGRLLKLREAHE